MGSISKVGFFGLLAVIIVGCTKSPISIPEESSEKAGGESADFIKQWQEELPIDTAFSTFSGKELLKHLKGLSDYMEQASKDLQTRSVKQIDELPSRDVRIESVDDIHFYHKYMERQHNYNSNISSSGQSILPFQKLSMMALQIQFTQMKVDTQRYKKTSDSPST